MAENNYAIQIIRPTLQNGDVEYQDTVLSGNAGVTVLIAGLTGGTVYLELFAGNEWRRVPELTFTADTHQAFDIAPGRVCRIATVGATWDVAPANPIVEINLRGRFS